MEYKVALIIIYNHQYNSNIEILESIYKSRFSNIFHLIPYYRGTKENVIPVYENSYYFQGYVAQGLKKYFNTEYTHYFFIADDLILNPIINENNYYIHLKLGKSACFLPGYVSLHESKGFWHRTGEAYRFHIDVPGTEIKNQLPDYEQALTLFKKFDLEIRPLTYYQIWGSPFSYQNIVQMVKRDRFWYLILLKSFIVFKRYNLSYPIVGSYSDIFVVSSNSIEQFCHYCGVTASINLHAELGVPTSMVLSAKNIVTEKEIDLRGRPLWTEVDLKVLDKYENNLGKLIREFPANYLYLHPIKLSRWHL